MGEENPVIRLKNMAIGDFARKYSEGDMPIVNIWLTGSCYLNCRITDSKRFTVIYSVVPRMNFNATGHSMTPE